MGFIFCNLPLEMLFTYLKLAILSTDVAAIIMRNIADGLFIGDLGLKPPNRQIKFFINISRYMVHTYKQTDRQTDKLVG